MNVNFAPEAVDDWVLTNEDTQVSIPVVNNDIDLDGTLLPSTVEIITQPSHGQIVSIDDGVVTYQPDANYPNLRPPQRMVSIPWSPSPGTLVNNIQTALDGILGVGNTAVASQSSTEYTVTFTGDLSEADLADMTVGSGLIGTAPSVRLSTVRDGTVGTDEIQKLTFGGTITGGSVIVNFGSYLPDIFKYRIMDDDQQNSNVGVVTVRIYEVPDYQNPVLPADVNASGQVSPMDALIVINKINSTPGGALPLDPGPGEPAPPYIDNADPANNLFFWDVNGDNVVSAADALPVINVLNAQILGGSGEGNDAASDVVVGLAHTGDGLAGEGEFVALPAAFAHSLPGPALPSLSPTASQTQLGPANQQDEQEVVRTARRVDLAATTPVRDSAFNAIGTDSDELIDLAMDDVLSDIASDVGGAHTGQVPEDWVLGGLRLRS